ncbi:hypothetical protein [Vibrio owensii]|uniref:hypothetical protein n=1 Tax=Vibrio harveyi group TaxID=717610 RepID=UPI003CC5F866
MSDKVFQRFNTVIEHKWAKLSDKMRSIYGTESNFTKQCIANGELKDWIESLNGLELDRQQVNHIAMCLVKHGVCKPSSVHTQLALMCRLNDVELPLVEGILTSEFWVNHFKKKRYTLVA